MPSDVDVRTETPEETGTAAPTAEVLERLGPALDPFRSAVAEAAEEVRLYRARHEEIAADPAGRLARELGPFAQGRIDATRLVGLLGDGVALDPLADRIMAVAHESFLAAGSGGAGSYRLSVPEGADLRDAVRDALAEVGRIFATARAVEKARDGRYQPDRDHTLLHAHPFHRWSAGERALAPPLVVEVPGKGLRAAGLLEFMEGGQKFVLSVRGAAPPAPLARLATPGVFVAQVEASAGLDAVALLADHEGPGVVALFEEASGALPFVYAPDGSVEVDDAALRAASDKADGTSGQPGSLDLRYLAGLVAVSRRMAESVAGPGGPKEALHVEPAPTAGAAGASPGAPEVSPGPEPTADQLADWLLARTDPTTD